MFKRVTNHVKRTEEGFFSVTRSDGQTHRRWWGGNKQKKESICFKSKRASRQMVSSLKTLLRNSSINVTHSELYTLRRMHLQPKDQYRVFPHPPNSPKKYIPLPAPKRPLALTCKPFQDIHQSRSSQARKVGGDTQFNAQLSSKWSKRQ